VNNKFFIKN